VLAVALLAHTCEVVAFYHTLEAFTFGSTYYIDLFTFSEDLAGNGFA